MNSLSASVALVPAVHGPVAHAPRVDPGASNVNSVGRPNGTHQPPVSCARLPGSRLAATSPRHRWPGTTDGKSTPPRDGTQALRYLERGAVGGLAS